MEFNAKRETDASLKVAIWGHQVDGRRSTLRVYLDDRRIGTETITSNSFQEFWFNVAEKENDWYDVTVTFDGYDVPHQYGGYSQSIRIGGIGRRAYFDAAYIEEDDEIKVTVWGAELDGFIVMGEVFTDESERLGYIRLRNGGGTSYFDASYMSSGTVGIEIDVGENRIEAYQSSSRYTAYVRIPARIKPVTRIIPTKVIWGNKNPAIEFKANGEGEVDLYSLTLDKYIKTNIYVTEGDNYLRLSNSETGDMLGYRDMPPGTCWFTKDGRHITKDPMQFYLIREFSFTTFDGEYNASVDLGDAQAVAFSSLTREWKRLLNGFYYISSAVDGYFGNAVYGQFYPQTGRVITADMYNDLISNAADLASRIEYRDYLPDDVSKGEVISKSFISDLGKVYNDGVWYLQKINSPVG